MHKYGWENYLNIYLTNIKKTVEHIPEIQCYFTYVSPRIHLSSSLNDVPPRANLSPLSQVTSETLERFEFHGTRLRITIYVLCSVQLSPGVRWTSCPPQWSCFNLSINNIYFLRVFHVGISSSKKIKHKECPTVLKKWNTRVAHRTNVPHSTADVASAEFWKNSRPAYIWS